jgi:DNA-binding beta-propeller fold protein YncE
LWSTLLFAAGFALASACNVADVQFTNTTVPTLSGKPGSFDVLEIDQANHRLYLTDRTNQGIDVFDISSATASFVQTIALPSSPNGLAIAPDLGRLFVGASSGSVVIIDINPKSPTAGTAVQDIKTGGTEADLLDYSAARQEVFASNAKDGTIASINATTGEVKAHYKVGSVLEQPRFNPADGMLYVTSPVANALFQIDPNNGSIKINTLLDKCQPGGLAINPRSNQALIACAASVRSLDLRTGQKGAFDQVPGVDVVTYNAKVDRFFVAAPGRHAKAQVGMFGGNPIAYIGVVATTAAGKAAAYDETNNVVYTPDMRLNHAGLTSFRRPSSDDISPSFVMSMGTLVAFITAVGYVLYLLARSADPIHRHMAEEEQAAAAAAKRRPKRAAVDGMVNN